MKIFDRLQKVEKRFALTFMGFIVTVLAIGYAVYVENFKIRAPELTFTVLSSTNVVDLKEDIEELNIIYQDENLLRAKKKLTVHIIEVKNEGNINITQNDYDINTNWGLVITNGNLISKPEIIETSDDYLLDAISNLTVDSLNRVMFPKVIFEIDELFVLKILTISEQGIKPKIESFGKIAGIKKLKPVQNRKEKENKTFIEKIFYGSVGIHLARIFLYLLSLIIFGIGSILLISELDAKLKDCKIKKNIAKFKKVNKDKVGVRHDKIFDLYLKYKEAFIMKANLILSDDKRLNRIIQLNAIQKEKLNLAKNDDHDLYEPYRREFVNEALETYPLNDFVIHKLLQEDFIIHDSETNSYSINNQLAEVLNDIVYFIKLQ